MSWTLPATKQNVRMMWRRRIVAVSSLRVKRFFSAVAGVPERFVLRPDSGARASGHRTARPALAPTPSFGPRTRCWRAPLPPAKPAAAPGRHRQHSHSVAQVGLVHAQHHGLPVPHRLGQHLPRKRPVTAVTSNKGFFHLVPQPLFAHVLALGFQRQQASQFHRVWRLAPAIAPTASDSFSTTVLRTPGSAVASPHSTASASFHTVPKAALNQKLRKFHSLPETER